MEMELKKAVEINDREVIYHLFSPAYVHVNETDGGHIELDVTDGIEGKEVTWANISLYSKEHRITSFSVSPTIFTGKDLLRKTLSFPINQKVVTGLRIRVWCDGGGNYEFNLSEIPYNKAKH